MNFKDFNVESSYTGIGEQIKNQFLLPVLSASNKYDRITGYFTVNSLLSISQGIEKLFEKQGKMRLIIGVHSVPEALLDAINDTSELEREILLIREKIKEQIMSLQDALKKKQIATIAWMIEDGLLEVKAVAVKGQGIFHPKTFIFSDCDGNEIAAIGSPNETENGIGGNFEQIVVLKSWENQSGVNGMKDFFNSLWFNTVDDLIVMDISEVTREMIRDSVGNQFPNPHQVSHIEENVISKMAEMPANYFVSGHIPSLFMHQERAVLDALSRWPVRVMFSDEVGLGKTFEAAATLAFLVKYCNVKRVVILTPKSVLYQWQDELNTHFCIDAWVYESGRKEYVSSNGRIISVRNKHPLEKGTPNIILMSSQYARGSKNTKDVFSSDKAIMPDLLIVDEAHSARISMDIGGNKKKTQMYKMLENISTKIPHLILATATPMQKTADEYHAMLKLLGLPISWQKEENFDLSLKIIGSNINLDLTNKTKAVQLLYSVIQIMKPNLDILDGKEKRVVNTISNNYRSMSKLERTDFITNNWDAFKRAFIKLHPARLLTVRNTRKSLINVGYKFPVRNLNVVDLINSNEIELFYEQVNRYLETICFSIEKALYPDRRVNIGFIKVSYQQRVASSLYSCMKSLSRRMENAKRVRDKLMNNRQITRMDIDLFDVNQILDDFDNDELLKQDNHLADNDNESAIDVNDLLRSANLEYAALASLVHRAEELIAIVGDKKINSSIELALKKVHEGDRVLLFSRYTDTIEALLKKFKKECRNINYAIYTGNQSLIVIDGIPTECDKKLIKDNLNSGVVKIVFCSDAASEGLNLQAARVLINVDVPWVPARLEQRIGRVARLGQLADEVDIYNVWYPNSIEAKMYRRIHARLQEANLAIGEFPEVVANQIRDAILTNNEANTELQELIQVRNSLQVKTLENLWASTSKRITVSEVIRAQLIELCDKSFVKLGSNDTHINRYMMPNNEIVCLSSNPGMKESISLSSIPWKYVDFSVNNIQLLSNNNVPVCFAKYDDGKPIKFDKILDLISGWDNTDSNILNEWPNTLMRASNLTMKDFVEISVVDSPYFWIGECKHES